MPQFYMGNDVVIASGFCATNGIVALLAKGVYDNALIKKHWYWPKIVPGYLIDWIFL